MALEKTKAATSHQIIIIIIIVKYRPKSKMYPYYETHPDSLDFGRSAVYIQ